jgi:O-antigen/teichoic acid export membrane protein
VFKIFQSTFFFSLARLIEALVSFILLGILTRIFAPEVFGILAILQLYCSIMAILIDSRLNTAFSIRFYQDDTSSRIGRLYQILGYNVLLYLSLSVPIFFFPDTILDILQLSGKASINSLYLAQLFILFRVIYNFFTNLLVLERKAKLFCFTVCLFSVFYLGAAIFFYIILHITNYEYWFICQIIGLSAGLLVAIIYLWSNYPILKGSINLSLLKDVVILGLPLIPAGLLSIFQSSADRYMLNYFGFLTDTGLYATAAKFPMLISSVVLIPVGQVLTPFILKAYASSNEHFILLQTTFFELSLLIQMLILSYYSFFLYEIYPYFIGPDYQSSYPLAVLLLISICFISIGQSFCGVLLVTGKTMITLKISVFSMIINVITNAILIPYYNVYGAIIASILSSVIGAIVCFILNQKIIKIKYNLKFFAVVSLVSIINISAILLLSPTGNHLVISSLIKLTIISITIVLFAFVLYRSRVIEIYRTLTTISK